MSVVNVIITESAYRDLDKITDFLLDKNPAVALRIYNKLIDSYKRLAQFPLMGTVMQETLLRNENYRRLVTGDYVTIYRFIAGSCVIEHVFHGKENYRSHFAGPMPKRD